MNQSADVRGFLMSRRARITPAQVGLSAGSRRRVPGLRRSEVAELAGVSVEYYSRLERGDLRGVSASVLEGVARALRLDEAEYSHLLNLASDQNAGTIRSTRHSSPSSTVRPGLQWTLDRICDAPAIVGNSRSDLIAANSLALALYSGMLAGERRPANFARYQFLDDSSRKFYREWDVMADITVANLRTHAGRNPHSRDLQDLVGELSTLSDEFRTRWGRHDVRIHGNGVKRFHHHIVGDLDLAFEGLELAGDPDLGMAIYSAEPGSPTDERLKLLGSWAADTAVRVL